jgi:hypothetical protein
MRIGIPAYEVAEVVGGLLEAYAEYRDCKIVGSQRHDDASERLKKAFRKFADLAESHQLRSHS